MQSQLIHRLLVEEIERIVAEARIDRRVVKAGRHAPDLLRAYAACGLSADQMVNEIGAVAACAGVPVELSRPDRWSEQLDGGSPECERRLPS